MVVTVFVRVCISDIIHDFDELEVSVFDNLLIIRSFLFLQLALD